MFAFARPFAKRKRSPDENEAEHKAPLLHPSPLPPPPPRTRGAALLEARQLNADAFATTKHKKSRSGRHATKKAKTTGEAAATRAPVDALTALRAVVAASADAAAAAEKAAAEAAEAAVRVQALLVDARAVASTRAWRPARRASAPF